VRCALWVTLLVCPLVVASSFRRVTSQRHRLDFWSSALRTTAPVQLEPPTMRTRSVAEPRLDVMDRSASDVRRTDRVAPPVEVRDSLSDDGDVAFVYSRGPFTGIQVTRADVRSLEAGQEARDALVDALARYIWQEELSSSDARGCLVFCSIFYKILRERGPAAVRSMTQRVNVFDYSTWVFFFCEGNHWWSAVVHDVPRLERALRMSADGRAARTGRSVATLAFFNSLGGGGASRYSRVHSSLFGWVRTVALEIIGAETATPPERWVATCLSVVSPSVPQQGATVDCGMYALSFFSSFFKCSVEDRRTLLHSGAAGKSAWSSGFVMKTREELLAVCNILEARHTAAAARQRAPRLLTVTPAPDARKTGGVSGSPPSRRLAFTPTAANSPKPRHSTLCSELPTMTKPAPPPLRPSKRTGESVLTGGLAQDGDATGPHLPAQARGSSPQARGHGAAAGTSSKMTAPTRPKTAKRRRLSREDAAAAAWLAAFKMWGLDYEPVVARDLVVIFSACDALLPSFITHYASGVAQWCPPVNHEGLEQWFVDVLRTGPGHGGKGEGRAGSGDGISRVMLSRVHGVFSAAYAFHGTPLPGA